MDRAIWIGLVANSRARNERTEKAPKSRVWVSIVGGVAIGVIAAFIIFGPLWTSPFENSHEYAAGKVIDTRIIPFGTRETYHGGKILYRIEALVRYDLRGQPQQRWMPASDVTTDRDLLALWLVKHPSSCEVDWAPHHPETPRCNLKP